MTNEPERDSNLADALRRAEGEPPFAAVDWSRLQRRISERASLPLARLKRGVVWWDYTARWARAAIPLAVAAALVVLATLPGDVDSSRAARGSAAGLLEREGLALAWTGDVPEREVFDAVVGPTDREWLLETLMEGGER